MKPTPVLQRIAIDQLRIGMHVHLDVGWMSHPFPLSHFKVASPEQLATIRSLGLATVRIELDDEQEDAPGVTDEPAQGPQAGATPAPPPPAMTDAALAHRAALFAQQESLALCQGQFTEAVDCCERAVALLRPQPQGAGENVKTLVGALLDKMLVGPEMCIRLLSGEAGERAGAHAMNVAVLSLLLAKTFDFPRAEMLDLGVGAMLHDVGKLDLPESVRYRDPSFAPDEVLAYEDHVARGVAHARRMGLTAAALLVIAQHHEHSDGTGFPMRLSSDRITAASRIVAMVNRYDNLCNPHRGPGMTPHEALSTMFAQAQAKFDTSMLGAFIKMLGVYPPGSVVQLTDDRHALVVSVNAGRPLKPRVLVHEPRIPREQALIVDLETMPGLGIRRSLRLSQLPSGVHEYLRPQARVVYFFEAAQESMKRDLPQQACA